MEGGKPEKKEVDISTVKSGFLNERLKSSVNTGKPTRSEDHHPSNISKPLGEASPFLS